jgi:hypothetical protein
MGNNWPSVRGVNYTNFKYRKSLSVNKKNILYTLILILPFRSYLGAIANMGYVAVSTLPIIKFYQFFGIIVLKLETFTFFNYGKTN